MQHLEGEMLPRCLACIRYDKTEKQIRLSHVFPCSGKVSSLPGLGSSCICSFYWEKSCNLAGPPISSGDSDNLKQATLSQARQERDSWVPCCYGCPFSGSFSHFL